MKSVGVQSQNAAGESASAAVIMMDRLRSLQRVVTLLNILVHHGADGGE
jgi:hypothetical protein